MTLAPHRIQASRVPLTSPNGSHEAAPVLDDPPARVPAFGVVVVGASAGGLAALSKLLGELSVGFPAPVAIVLHLSPDHPSMLVGVLSRCTRLPVVWATEGARMSPGTVYVAPPDRHLVFQRNGDASLLDSTPVHFARPSVDLLFASAAHAFGKRTLAVILTGNGYDGSKGVAEVHDAGGVVIAQDEASSEFFSMPREAIESGGVSYVLPLASIGTAVRRLVTLGAAAGVTENG